MQKQRGASSQEKRVAQSKKAIDQARGNVSSNNQEELLDERLKEVASFVENCEDKQCLLALKRVLVNRMRDVFKGSPERNLEIKGGYCYETYNDNETGKKKYIYAHNKLRGSVKDVVLKSGKPKD